MVAPVVVGIDPSLTATGIALSDGSLITVGGDAKRGDERLLDISCAVGSACHNADLIVIENYVNGSPSAGVSGQVHGVVRLMCLRASVPYAMVPPTTLKKYATGSGAAKKADMRMALYKRTGLDCNDPDQVDAWWLRAAGLQWLGCPVVTLPAVQVKALDAAQWPETPVRGAA